MLTLNSGLENELNKSFRQGITFKVVMSTFDSYFWQVATVSTAGSPLDIICEKTELVDVFSDNVTNKGFATFEPNIYDVDDTKRFFRKQLPDEPSEEYIKNFSTGLISRDFYYSPTTKENPFFEKDVLIDNLGTPYKMTGLTIQFGEDKQIYPTHIVLDFYDSSGTVVKSIEDFLSSNRYSTIFSLTDVAKIKIKVLEMSKTGVKLRISQILSGTEITFDKEIVSVDVKRNSNPFATGLPKFECNVRLYDENGLFEPQNPQGIYYSLVLPEIRLYCVYDGNEDLVGTYMMPETPSTNGMEVTIKGKSPTFHRISSNTSTLSGYTDFALSALMETALQMCRANLSDEFPFVNVPFYRVPRNYSYIKNERPSTVISKISNTMFGMITEDNRGFSKIKTPIINKGDATLNFVLDKTKVMGRIVLDTSTPILNTFSAQKYLDDGTGKKVENDVWGNADADFKIDNNYIISEDIYNFLSNCFETWIKRTQKYKIPYMADPRIEVGDIVEFENEYGVNLYGIVAENNYSYPNFTNGNLTVYTIPEDTIGRG